MADEPARSPSQETTEERVRAAEERARLLETRLHAERAARRLGLVDEDAAFRLLDVERIEFDEAGHPANIEALMKELAERRPWLCAVRDGAGAASSGASPTNPSRDGFRTLTRDAIRRMSPDEINANWDAVEAALRER